MPDGLYRPYFHGELVAEYRKKSIAGNNGVQKPPINGAEPARAEAPTSAEPVEEYVEPGEHRRLSPRASNRETRERILE